MKTQTVDNIVSQTKNGSVVFDPYVKLMRGGTDELADDSGVRFSFDLDFMDFKKIQKIYCVVKSRSHSMMFDTSIEELEEVVRLLKLEKQNIENGKYEQETRVK